MFDIILVIAVAIGFGVLACASRSEMEAWQEEQMKRYR